MTQKEKAEAYDEAIERAKKIHNEHKAQPFDIMLKIFPELKESESERISKGIKSILEHYKESGEVVCPYPFVSIDEALAWLEKQGKNKDLPNVTDRETLDEYAYQVAYDLSHDWMKETPTWDDVETACKLGAKWLEKQGEQKPADMVEPKFHKGDWAVSNLDGKARQILEVHYDEYNNYYVVENDAHNIEEYDRLHHLWTIQDAKDGDVLVHNGCTFIFMGIKSGIVQALEENLIDGTNPVCFGEPDKGSEYHPATKEQYDTLMKAMANKGYVFDFKKKKLNKIEQKQVVDYPDSLPKDNWELVHEFVEKFGRIPEDEDELNVLVEYVFKRQNPAWSEEDIIHLNKCISYMSRLDSSEMDWLKSLKERALPQPKQEWSEEDVHNIQDIDSVLFYDKNLPEDTYTRLHNWLKSILRPQDRWKPSDKQMEALKEACDKHWEPDGLHPLYTLWEQLKKLKE